MQAGKKDMRKIFIDSELTLGDMYYDICSAALHHGRSGRGGHYTSLSKIGEQWWAVDDHSWKKVGNIKESLLKIQGGANNCSYIVVYKRR